MLFDLAAASAFLSVLSLILACLFLALFFKKGGRFGPLNDIFSAITLLLLILPALAIDYQVNEIAGSWISVITWVAITGMVVGAIGQFLLVSGLISLKASFFTGGFGILPVLIWMISLVILTFSLEQLPEYVGWTTISTLALIVLLSAVQMLHNTFTKWALGFLFMVSMVVWLGALGNYFLQT